MMRTLTNERGVALVTSLLLTLISLAIVLVALYFITQQTQLSAASKRYKSSLEAAHGGVEVFTKDIIPQLFNNPSGVPALFNNIALVQGQLSSSCLSDKVKKSTADWGCGASNKMINPATNLPYDLRSTYDYKFTLQGVPSQPGFSVYTKLVDTQKGNSDTTGYGETLLIGAAVTGGLSAAGSVTPQHIPAIYRIEVQGERSTNPLEKAHLTVLYAY
jgi:hypothetical protein